MINYFFTMGVVVGCLMVTLFSVIAFYLIDKYEKRKLKKNLMIIINKPVEVQCYLCKTILIVPPEANMNSPYFTICNLHKPKSENEQVDLLNTENFINE